MASSTRGRYEYTGWAICGGMRRSEKTSHKVQARMHGTRWRRLVELLMLRENLALERLCQGRWPLEQAAEIVLSGWYGMGFSWRFSFCTHVL